MIPTMRRRLMCSGGGLPPVGITLEEATWEQINAVAAAGTASDYWSVGDTKTIIFSSAVLGSMSIQVEILGFDYDDLADGSGKAPFSFGMVDCFATKQSMNLFSDNEGGWRSCRLRATIINTLFPAFVSAVGANIIKPVSKRTSAGSMSATINTTTDSLWLMSEYEIFGAAPYSFAGEKPTDKSICYPAFTDANSRIKRIGASATFWWERSPTVDRNVCFDEVSTSGTAGTAGASTSYGVAVGFCV